MLVTKKYFGHPTPLSAVYQLQVLQRFLHRTISLSQIIDIVCITDDTFDMHVALEVVEVLLCDLLLGLPEVLLS